MHLLAASWVFCFSSVNAHSLRKQMAQVKKMLDVFIIFCFCNEVLRTTVAHRKEFVLAYAFRGRVPNGSRGFSSSLRCRGLGLKTLSPVRSLSAGAWSRELREGRKWGGAATSRPAPSGFLVWQLRLGTTTHWGWKAHPHEL